jgi:hypothetical protein
MTTNGEALASRFPAPLRTLGRTALAAGTSYAALRHLAEALERIDRPGMIRTTHRLEELEARVHELESLPSVAGELEERRRSSQMPGTGPPTSPAHNGPPA